MLRRLLLGQPRRDETMDKKKICDEEKRIPDAFMQKSTANNLEKKVEAKYDISDSDTETDSSETEDSDAETLDNSSRTGSYEDCSADVLEWKGFEMVRDASVHGGPIGSCKGNGGTLEMKGNCQDQNGGAKQSQENPFAHAFEIQGSGMPHDEIKSEIIDSNNKNNNNNKTNNSSKTNNNINNNNSNENNKLCNNNDQNNNNGSENNSDSTSSQIYSKQTNHVNDNKTATTIALANNTVSPNDRKTTDATKLTVNTKNNTINNQKEIRNPKQKINKTRQTKYDQSKTTLQFPKPSTTNQKPPNTKTISRHYSIRENQHTSNIKGQTCSRINTGRKSPSSASIPGKGPKVCKAQNSLTGHQGVGKNNTGLRRGKIADKRKQGSISPSEVSVKDLEKILGVNLTELREVIKTYKYEKIGTGGDFPRQNDVAQGNVDSQGMVGDHLLGQKKSQDGCKKDEIKERKSETLDNKDEISSDSGVSEPDAHSTDSQPHYITLKAIIKRKEYLEGQIRKLEDRIVVMGDHKKDVQFIHDLFDLHSDGLAKVERSNVGLACVADMKNILACQLREIEEDEFKAKLKGLEDLGIPNFPEINARIEKLQKRIRHTLDDERKCRSKGVQKLRFEIGKVQGMCEAVLDLVYTE